MLSTTTAGDGALDRSRSPQLQDGLEQTYAPAAPREVGGREGPDPTRYGDWEKGGRCIDF
ncbi:MAG TPA: DUF1674 domain-containing protein [Steroidobacter sp.]|nr:DUF1674 domain-containing protein [Steroidobacteraceae bacterium]HLS81434.1 DUF1674 domain-containing protein [Steroidobacter sp.]